MIRGNRVWANLKMALLAAFICLAASGASWGADAGSYEKLHLPLTLPGFTAEIKSLRFYAGDYTGSVGYAKRRYQERFVAAPKKFINWELVLDHPIARESRVWFPISAILYDPGGQVVEKNEALAWIEPDMHWSQWGGTFKVDAWKPGTYQVAIIIEGREYVRRPLQVASPGEDFQKLKARVGALRFFESERTIPPKNERNYSESFAQSQARYINWELNLDFPAPSQPVEFYVESSWFGPKGTVLDRITTKHTIQAGWDGSNHASGRGYALPGKWEPGTYRVVLKISDKEVASGSFQIVAEKEAAASRAVDFLQVYEAKVVSLKCFGDGKTAPPPTRRVYQEKFPRRTAQYIYWELALEVKKPPPQPATFTLESIWFGPEGNILYRQPTAFTLGPDSKAPVFLDSLGYGEPGRWQPGAYRVEMVIEGKVAAFGSFAVAD